MKKEEESLEVATNWKKVPPWMYKHIRKCSKYYEKQCLGDHK